MLRSHGGEYEALLEEVYQYFRGACNLITLIMEAAAH